MASLSPEMDGTYTLGADGMYYPNLELPEEEMPRYGKYSRIPGNYRITESPRSTRLGRCYE